MPVARTMTREAVVVVSIVEEIAVRHAVMSVRELSQDPVRANQIAQVCVYPHAEVNAIPQPKTMVKIWH